MYKYNEAKTHIPGLKKPTLFKGVQASPYSLPPGKTI